MCAEMLNVCVCVCVRRRVEVHESIYGFTSTKSPGDTVVVGGAAVVAGNSCTIRQALTVGLYLYSKKASV